MKISKARYIKYCCNLLVCFFLITYFYQDTFAGTKEEYYKNQLYFLTDAGYNVITTSSRPQKQILGKDEPSYLGSIVICDSPLSTFGGISCDYFHADIPGNAQKNGEFVMIEIIDDRENVMDIVKTEDGSTVIYFIPEIYFVAPIHNQYLMQYLNGLPKLKNYPADQKTVTLQHQYEREFLLLVLMCLAMVTTIALTPRSFLKSENKSVLIKLRLLALILFTTVSVIYVISIIPDRNSLFTQLSELYSVLKRTITSAPFAEISIIFVSILGSVVLLFLIRNLSFPERLLTTTKKIQRIYGVLTLTFSFVLLIIASGNFIGLFIDVIYSLLFLLIIIRLLPIRNLRLGSPYFEKGKLRISLLFVLCVVIGTLIRKQTMLPYFRTTTVYLADTSIDSKPALKLPKDLKLDFSKKAESFDIDVKNDIFLNDILISSKFGYTKINNVPIRELSQDVTNPTIISTKRENYIDNVIKNEVFEKAVVSSEVSKIFKVLGSPGNESETNLVLKFHCERGLKPAVLSIIKYSIFSQNPTINPRVEKLIYFPGCASEELDEYVVPLDITASDLFNSVFEISGIRSPAISNIQILYENESVIMRFYKDPDTNVFVADGRSSNNKVQSELTTYSTELSERISIKRDAKKINLGITINELFLLGYIEKNVSIWSPDTAILVKLIK